MTVPFRSFLVAVLALGTMSPLGGQTSQTLDDYRHDLGQIQGEITGLRSRIDRLDQAEQSTEKTLAGLEEKIFYQRRLIKVLDRSRRPLARSVAAAEGRIAKQEEELARRRALLARRARHLYIHGRTRELEALLMSESVAQTQVRLRYLQYFIQQDREQLETIKGLLAGLRRDKAAVEVDLAAKDRNRRDHEREVAKLGRSQGERKGRQTALRKDRRAAERELQAKEASLSRIQTMVERLSREAVSAAPGRAPFVPDVPFASLKGRMIWPVRGPVLARFGKNRNIALKTETINPGVDIGAAVGHVVHAVAQGRVADARWMPGFGVMLFVWHDDGYVTVYSPMGEISVALGQEIKGGKPLGLVGETGSSPNPHLNFMIYHGSTKLDPQQWLQRSISHR